MDKRGKSKDQADDKMMYLIWNNIIDVMLTAADERYIDIYIYIYMHTYICIPPCLMVFVVPSWAR